MDAMASFAKIVADFSGKPLAVVAPKVVAKPAAKSKGVTKKEPTKKKEKKEPEAKPTLEDLDADLSSYLSARKGGEAEMTETSAAEETVVA